MEQFLRLVNKLGAARIGAIAVITIGVLFFFVYLTARLSSTELSLLYTELSPQDSASIINELETMKVAYALDERTNQIRVDSKEVGRVRMILAEKGIPDGGNIGYEIFDKEEGFGVTRFKQDINKLRAMEGELARTVGTLKPIETARIHLVLPQRELFMKEAQEATASVFVKIRSGQNLSQEQISAVQHLVATAVPGLKPTAVSIVDQMGNLLANGREDNTQASRTQRIDSMRTAYEHRLSAAVEDIIGRTVGFGKVRAHISAQMNFDQITTDAEIFDPEGQIVRSTQTSEEKESETNPSNAVTVQNNLPGLPGGGGDSGGRNANKIEEITNYEISKTIKKHITEGGKVDRLSVAVLIDGDYRTKEDKTIEYIPRTVEEMKQIEALVRSAVGFDEKRGDTIEVANLRFANGEQIVALDKKDPGFMGLEKEDWMKIAETITLGFVALLVILLVLRPMVTALVSRSEDEEVSEEEYLLEEQKQHALAAPETGTLSEALPDEVDDGKMVNIESIEGKVRESSLKKVTSIIENHPTETVSILRNWMFQET